MILNESTYKRKALGMEMSLPSWKSGSRDGNKNVEDSHIFIYIYIYEIKYMCVNVCLYKMLSIYIFEAMRFYIHIL